MNGKGNFEQKSYIKPGIINAVITEFRDATPEEVKKNYGNPYIVVGFLEPSTGAILTDRWEVTEEVRPNAKFSKLYWTTKRIENVIQALNPHTDLPHDLEVQAVSKLIVGKEGRYKFIGKESKSAKSGKIVVYARGGYPPFVENLETSVKDSKLKYDRNNKFDYQPLVELPGEKTKHVETVFWSKEDEDKEGNLPF